YRLDTRRPVEMHCRGYYASFASADPQRNPIGIVTISVDCVGRALGGSRLRLAGKPSRTAPNIIRQSDFICHGVVITSISARLRLRSSNAAFKEPNGNFRVCFSRLK